MISFSFKQTTRSVKAMLSNRILQSFLPHGNASKCFKTHKAWPLHHRKRGLLYARRAAGEGRSHAQCRVAGQSLFARILSKSTDEISRVYSRFLVECHSMNNKKPGKTNDAAILAASHCLLKGSK